MKLIQIFLLIFMLCANLFAQEENTIQADESNAAAKKESKDKMSRDVKDHYRTEKDSAVWYIVSGTTTTALGLYYRREYENHFNDPLKDALSGEGFLPFNKKERFPWMEEGNQFPYTTISNPFQKQDKNVIQSALGKYAGNGGADFPHFGGKDNTHFALGFSYPLLGVGLFHLGTGALMYFNSDKKEKDAQKELQSSPNAFKDEEVKRLDRLATFNKYTTYFNYSMIGGGVLSMYAGSVNNSEYLKGMGFGFLVQGLLSLALDHFANKRFAAYKEKIVNFQMGYVPATRGANVYAANQNSVGGVSGEGLYTFSMTYRF